MDEDVTSQQPVSGEKSVPPPPPLPPPVRKRKLGLTLAVVFGLLILIAAILLYYLHFIAPYESTDDAFITAHVTMVSPRVSGQVIRLLIHDNQFLTEGELMVEIDPHDYETRLAQAVADVATAKSQVAQANAETVVDEARLAQQKAAIISAEAQAQLAEADLKRYQSVESRAVSRTQIDFATTQSKSTAAALEVARQQAKAAEAEVALSHVNVETAAANLQRAEALLEQAKLDLSYTRIIAPITGRVTQRTVEQGAYVTTGQVLLDLVPTNVWVVANFKETQLTHMRPGQPVRIHLDAYPGQYFKGKVDSLQAGSGAAFSLLPPENAVGNYVKVVQRVPVKITFDEPLDPKFDIAPGMSVEPKVRVQ